MTPVFIHHSDAINYAGVCDFISCRIWGKPRNMPDGTAMAVVDGEKLAAGVLLHNYDEDNGTIEVSAASDSKLWMTRPVLFALFQHAFDVIGCQAVVMRTDPSNKPLARILSAYGFSRHTIPRLRGRDSAEQIFVLGDDVWRKNGFHKENSNG